MEQNTSVNRGRHNFTKGVIVGLLVAALLVGAALTAVVHFTDGVVIGKKALAGNDILTDDVTAKIIELNGYINQFYFDDVQEEDLDNGLYAGLLEGLDDPYSAYYTPEEYTQLQIDATQNYCGIGAALSQNRETMIVTITHIYEGSPAEAAGLLDGDIINTADGIEGTSMELSDLVTHIRGEEGTTVHLEVYREGETEALEFDVERKNIDLPTVDSRMLNEKTGYIQITEFGSNTAEQFENAVSELNGQGMQAMIIDVRDNRGGMVTAVTSILDEILPEGTVVYTEDKNGNRQDFTSDAEKYMELPIAVLINGNSASASEILAGALRDYEYATLVGTTTYGKGIVQTIFPLSSGDAIKLTTAKYFTPNGENIHGTGIAPDIELEYEYAGEVTGEYDYSMDNQVQKAIETVEKDLDNE